MLLELFSNSIKDTKQKNINNLYEDIQKIKKFDHTIIDNYMNDIYKIKSSNVQTKDEKIKYMIDFLNYQSDKLNTHKQYLISLFTTIFLPLGVITGYFGMNFKSMGNLGIHHKGILSLKNSQIYILVSSIIFIILTVLFYKYIYNIF